MKLLKAMIKKFAIILYLTMFHLSAFAQQTYNLDAKKSKILWNTHNMMGGHHGYLLFSSGTLNYSPAGEPVNGSFNFNMKSIKATDHPSEADNQEVDKELRKTGFLAIDKYPGAVLKVNKLVRVGNSTVYKVAGDLTMKGITNPIEFTANLKPQGNAINVTAELEIHRFKWKIDLQPEPKVWDVLAAIKNEAIADEIAISVNLVITK